MSEEGDSQSVTLELERAEALVLYEWLSRLDDFSTDDQTPFVAATQRVRWDVECTLEASLSAVLAEDYETELAAAIDEVRDVGPN